MKSVASILFAFLLLWHPATPAVSSGACGGDMGFSCAGCCCCPAPISDSSIPVAPVQSRTATTEQVTLLLPTMTASLLLEQSAQTSRLPSLAEFSYSAGAVPLFQRDCALLL